MTMIEYRTLRKKTLDIPTWYLRAEQQAPRKHLDWEPPRDTVSQMHGGVSERLKIGYAMRDGVCE